MEATNEKDKLILLLKIPVTSVHFSNFFCELYFDDELIGFLPTKMSATGIVYEINPEDLKKLDWPKLCALNHTALQVAVEKATGRASFRIIPHSFKRLFIEDLNGNLFASFECYYTDNHWELIDEKILMPSNVEISKSFSL